MIQRYPMQIIRKSLPKRTRHSLVYVSQLLCVPFASRSCNMDLKAAEQKLRATLRFRQRQGRAPTAAPGRGFVKWFSQCVVCESRVASSRLRHDTAHGSTVRRTYTQGQLSCSQRLRSTPNHQWPYVDFAMIVCNSAGNWVIMYHIMVHDSQPCDVSCCHILAAMAAL